MDQLAQLYDISIDQIRQFKDATKVHSEEKEDLKSKDEQQNEAEKMNRNLSSLREKRITLQKEMAKMEIEMRQKRHAAQ